MQKMEKSVISTHQDQLTGANKLHVFVEKKEVFISALVFGDQYIDRWLRASWAKVPVI